MGDTDEDRIKTGKEKYFGIIAIQETGAAHVQMYKEGDDIDALAPKLLDDKKLLEKDKSYRVEKIVEKINKKNLFHHKEFWPPQYVLVISSPNDYTDEDFHGLRVPPQSTQYITIPELCSAPIVATINAIHEHPDKDETSAVKNIKKKFEGNQDNKNLDTSDRNKDPTKLSSQQIVSSTTEQDDSTTSLVVASYVPTVEQKYHRSGSVSSTNSKIDDKDSLSRRKTWNPFNKKGEDKDEKEELLNVMKSNFDKIEKRFDQLDEKLVRLEGQVNSLDAKLLTNPEKNDIAPILSRRKDPPAIPSSKGVRCHIFPAPQKVKLIQSQFTTQLTEKLMKERLHIQDDPTGPFFVFAVNSSRLISDIQRDLKSVTSNSPIFLLVIKPTNKPEVPAERLDIKDLGVEHLDVEDAAFLYVDINNRHLHECATNDETLISVIQFLNSKKQGTRV